VGALKPEHLLKGLSPYSFEKGENFSKTKEKTTRGLRSKHRTTGDVITGGGVRTTSYLQGGWTRGGWEKGGESRAETKI